MLIFILGDEYRELPYGLNITFHLCFSRLLGYDTISCRLMFLHDDNRLGNLDLKIDAYVQPQARAVEDGQLLANLVSIHQLVDGDDATLTSHRRRPRPRTTLLATIVVFHWQVMWLSTYIRLFFPATVACRLRR